MSGQCENSRKQKREVEEVFNKEEKQKNGQENEWKNETEKPQ